MYGAFVRNVRTSRQLSQTQLAEVSGVSQSNISAIENDRRMPSADTLNRLLVACGYEMAAVAGSRAVFAPLPNAGWFPDDDVPPALPDDPIDERSTVNPDTTMDERNRMLMAALELSAAVVTARGRQ